MTDTGPEVRLTADEVALVLRRAAEIDAAGDTAVPEGYDAAAVEAAAGEVGLSPAAVRRAVAELRVGALQGPVHGWARRATLEAGSTRGHRRGRTAPATPVGELAVRSHDLVVDQRELSGRPQAVLDGLGRALRAQLFVAGRRTDDRAVFRPRDDVAARLRRRLDFTGAIVLDGVDSVTATVTPHGRGTLTRVEAQLATTRSSVVAGSAAAGAGAAVVTGVAGALAHEPAVLIAALPLGTAVAAGGIRVRGRQWERQRAEIADALATLLDRL